MHRKITFGILGIAMLVAPSFVAADQISDLQSQILSLIAQVKALLANQTPNLPVPTNVTPGNHLTGYSCPVFRRRLTVGLSGDDVIALQKFLLSDGAYTGTITGYFGSVTEQAVQTWQTTNGIVSYGEPSVTGYGVVGPVTQNAISRRCESGQSTIGQLSGTPTVGPAPLEVHFTANISGPNLFAGYTIDFGDGSGTGSCGFSNPAICPGHTYLRQGTYTARLFGAGSGASGIPLGSVSISVGPSISNNAFFVASPLNGIVPFVVNFSALMKPESHPLIQFGDGTSAEMTTAGSLSCGSDQQCDPGVVRFTASHNYAQAGLYSVVLTRTCSANVVSCLPLVGIATIRASSSVPVVGTPDASQKPSVSITSTPDSLNQGENLWILWSSFHAPTSSAIVLSLVSPDGLSNYGYIAKGKAQNGNVIWTVPGSNCNASGVCTVIADNPSVWKTSAGSYRVLAQLYSPADATLPGGLVLASSNLTYLASSTSDLITIVGSSTASTSGGGTDQTNQSTTSTPVVSNGTFAITGLEAPKYLMIGQQGTWTLHVSVPGGTNTHVTYSALWRDGSSYGAGSHDSTSVTQALPTFSYAFSYAGTYAPYFTVTYNGQTLSTTTVVTAGTASCGAACVQDPPRDGSCVTPWGGDFVANNGTISSEPWFTNGNYSKNGTPVIMKCHNGSWMRCNFQGNYCSAI